MEIRVDTNAAEVSGVLRRLFSDQVPFATSRAINSTATEFQRVQRSHMENVFQVRRERFVKGAVKVKPFATKRRLEAVVSIDPPGGKRRADILTKFESDREKLPFTGRTMAIPMEVRRTKSGVVSKPMYPKNLDLKHVSGRMSQGSRRTFAIRTDNGEGAIFQRYGRRGATDVRLLYLLVRRIPINPNLDFHLIAQEVVERKFFSYFTREFDLAVMTAR